MVDMKRHYFLVLDLISKVMMYNDSFRLLHFCDVVAFHQFQSPYFCAHFGTFMAANILSALLDQPPVFSLRRFLKHAQDMAPFWHLAIAVVACCRLHHLFCGADICSSPIEKKLRRLLVGVLVACSSFHLWIETIWESIVLLFLLSTLVLCEWIATIYPERLELI